MPRPRKRRRVCEVPKVKNYGPIFENEDITSEIDKDKIIFMTVEEYEIIRLVDYLGLNQEQSSEIMGVARSTIQRIYEDARKKIADSLVNGRRIRIEGGDYKLCEENDDMEICRGCNRRGKQCGNGGHRLRNNESWNNKEDINKVDNNEK
ncbi:DUF134 domain-containing protein [Clostridium sp. DL1XJH146]